MKKLKKSFRDCIVRSLERKDEKTGKSRMDLLADALVDKGISGDARAFEIIRNISGEASDTGLMVKMDAEAESFSR